MTVPGNAGDIVANGRKPRAVIAALSTDCTDVTSAEIPALVEEIWDAARLLPIVVITPVPSRIAGVLVDIDRVQAAIGPVARLVVLADHQVTEKLCALLPEAFHVRCGAVRVYLADARPNDHRNRNPWIYVKAGRAHEAEAAIIGALGKPPTAWTTTTPTSTSPAAAGPPPEVVKHTLDNPAADALAAQLVGLQERLSEAGRQIGCLRQEKKQLARDLASLEATVESGQRRTLPPAVFADAERQFRYEVEQLWMWTVAEDERCVQPLRRFALGRDWFQSLESMQLVDRFEVVSAVMDVLSGNGSKNNRQSHQQRTGKPGGSPALTRADGAVAWRCNIRSATPGAPRLLWWTLTDGGIELGKVALHDDNTLR